VGRCAGAERPRLRDAHARRLDAHEAQAQTGQAVLAYAWIGLVLLLVLSPHIGILLLSFGKVWSFSVVPDAYTLAHYATVFEDSPRMIGNTLLYCGLAGG